MSFLNTASARSIGFMQLGENTLISDKASFYNAPNISIGSNVRIDDFCILSAGAGSITINDNVHIACYSSIIGNASVIIDSFANISSRVSIYSSNDDYSGGSLTGPTIDYRFRNVYEKEVFIGKHVIIGSGAIVLPGVRLNTGAAIGALSLVKCDCDEFTIYGGVPSRPIKKREMNLIALEEQYIKRENE